MNHSILSQRFLLVSGLLCATILSLIQSYFGFYRNPIERLPIGEGYLLAALGGIVTLFLYIRQPVGYWISVKKSEAILLTACVPLAFILMEMSCTGTPFLGCTRVCTSFRFSIIPASVVLLFLGIKRPQLNQFGVGLLFLTLIPNCDCYNPVNGIWIDFMGLSPMCFHSPFFISILAILARMNPPYKIILYLGMIIGLGIELWFYLGHHLHLHGAAW